MRIFTVSAVTVGALAAVAEVSYLMRLRPFQADLGLHLASSLLVLWVGLAIAAIVRKERRAWLALLPLPFALIGPGLLGWLVVGCAINTGNCL